MEVIGNSFGVFGVFFYLVLAILWIMVPVFIYLISKRVKQMLNVMETSQSEIKELNASIKYLKRKYKESSE
jgi:predicted PurR-regulated permease PerM